MALQMTAMTNTASMMVLLVMMTTRINSSCLFNQCNFLIVYLSFYGHLLFCHGIPYWFKVAAYVPLTCQWFAYAAPSFHVSSMFNHVDLIELVLGSMVCRHSLSRLHTLAVLAHAHSIESS